MASMDYHRLAILAANPVGWDRNFVWVGQHNADGNSDFALSDNIQNSSLFHEDRYAGNFSYYRLVRDGDTLTGYLSADGLLWHPYAEHVRSDFPETLLVGIAQSSLTTRSPTARVGSFQINLLWRPGDFDHNGSLGCTDIAQLGEEIRSDSDNPEFDLTGDGKVDSSDLRAWLQIAGNANLGEGRSYRLGDANLDGQVNTDDYNRWNRRRWEYGAGWCGGDFNLDNITDRADFDYWNSSKFGERKIRAAGSSAIPLTEPSSLLWLLTTMAAAIGHRRACPA